MIRLLLLPLLLLFLVAPNAAAAETVVVVEAGGDIQAAIDSGADVVRLVGHHETLAPITIATDGVTLEGLGWDETSITSANGVALVLVTGSNSTVRDLKLVGAVTVDSFQTGLRWDSGTDHLAERVWVADTGHAGFYPRSPHITIRDSRTTNNGVGIFGDHGATDLLIEGSYIGDTHMEAGSGAGEQVYVYGERTRMIGNVIERTAESSHFNEQVDWRADDGTVRGNSFLAGVRAAGLMDSGDGTYIVDNTFVVEGPPPGQPSAIWVYGDQGHVIAGNTVTGYHYGVLIGGGVAYDAEHVVIWANTLTDNGIGVYVLQGVGSIYIFCNTITATDYYVQTGVIVLNVPNVVVFANEITGTYKPVWRLGG